MNGRALAARAVARHLIALLVLTLPTAASVRAATFVVDAGCTPPSGCDCNTIQPCVELAAPGDTVLVMAGVYTTQETRSVDVSGQLTDFTANVFLKDGVVVLGAGARGGAPAHVPAAVIDAGGTGIGLLADQLGAGSVLDNFIIRNGNASGPVWNSVGGGLLCLGADLTVQNCVFEQNQAGGQGGAIASELDGSPTIQLNTFNANQAVVDGGGVFCNGGGPGILNNVFEFNTAGEGAALRYIGSGTISDNVFRHNTGGSGLLADIGIRDGRETGATVMVRQNVFHDNTSALFLASQPTTVIEKNTVIRGSNGIDGLTPDVVFVRNNIVVSETGSGVVWSGTAPPLNCNDVWNNALDYDGLPDQTGSNDNIAADPLHCNPGSDDFALAENSPCAAANAGCGTLIGALDVACPPSAVEPASWGAIKASYRK